MTRITLADVARRAGVDVSTVSRVLRGEQRQRIRPEMRERILQAAKELDYSPDPLARALRTARTHSLAIAIPQIDNPVFSEAIRGAEEAARKAGFSLLISYRPEEWELPGGLKRLARAHRLEGLLVASLDADERVLEEVEAAGVPYVVLNRALPGAAYSVALDTRTAARMAAEHLLSLGHRRIAHLAGRPGGFNAGERMRGYGEALAERGLAFDPELVVPAGYTVAGGIAAMDELLRRPWPGDSRPTAIFAASLVSAAGALSELHRRNIPVPQKMSLVSIHDTQIAEILHPPLTTVATPTHEMGRIGVELLVAIIAGNTPVPIAPLPPRELVIRASSAQPEG
jgi:LacI family transcriptional regulator